MSNSFIYSLDFIEFNCTAVHSDNKYRLNSLAEYDSYVVVCPLPNMPRPVQLHAVVCKTEYCSIPNDQCTNGTNLFKVKPVFIRHSFHIESSRHASIDLPVACVCTWESQCHH